MNEKKIWKIEELWNKESYEKTPSTSKVHNDLNIKIQGNYPRGVSKFYPRFFLTDFFNYSISKKVVFTDDYGDYRGLEKLQLIIKDKPIYLFDNHNEIIYPFVEIYEALGKQSFSVVHIDAHPDDACFSGEKPKTLNISEVKNFIPQTRISDFFDVLSETLIIKDIQRATSSFEFEAFNISKEPYILSLDIDIFGPEGDFVDLETKVTVIKKAWAGAQAVCIATSPGFIDQDFASGIITIFYNT